ncbi:hypothetical protein EV191_1358 [Tamaricihabitans halophyticus]|uniref:Uncharacterized protein n=1 Tax=Tamaricihabitans halophyticus TaxID=1262583 RepID=A0A4R2PUQ9_9PSEU|nr:hypothetical protein [Tamaricihabitans halophyticus]TCP38934.1 hypothetical protein EV191_1358 [Tamaricihabitans halophyticus]
MDDEHIAALRKLVLAGWSGVPLGNPAEPEALVYTRGRLGILDSVHVRSYDNAMAIRAERGRNTRTSEGPVSKVVADVLSWQKGDDA